MLKIISIIICTIYAGYRVESTMSSTSFAIAAPIAADFQLAQIQAQRLPQDRDDTNAYLTRILILTGLISGVGIIGWQLYRQGASGKTTLIISNTTNKALIDRVSPKLRRQLLRLINDPKTANRLLMGIQRHHSDRDPDWLAEKVIYDLRRGR